MITQHGAAPAPMPNRLPGRLLVCSDTIPPQDSGASVVLGRLFRDIDPRDYRMVTFSSGVTEARAAVPPLPARTYRLQTPWEHPQPSSYRLAPIRTIRRYAMEALRRGRALARIAERDDCQALLVTSGGNPTLLGGLVASRLSRRPLIVHMLDHWRYQLPETALRFVLPALQPVVLARAHGVLVPNEALKAELDREHGVACTVVHNPIDPTFLDEGLTERPWPRSDDEMRIVYTGQVYAAQSDSIARLLNALESPRLRRFSLHVYTAQPSAHIAYGGLFGRLVVHPHMPAARIRDVHRSADILFLPLAFASPYPEIIRTSAPTKLGEYLASGTPILVHAPRGSYLAELARREGCAELVEEPSPESLVDAVQRITSDAEHRQRLVARAAAVAQRDYSPAATTGAFLAYVRAAMAEGAR